MGTPVYSYLGGSTTMSITLASLASSATYPFAGRQTAMINNENLNSTTNDGAMLIRVYYQISLGTTPTTNNVVQFFLLQGDAATPNITSDNAGLTDAAITIVTSSLVHVFQVPVATSWASYYGSFVVRNPGPLWGVAVVNSSGSPFNSTAAMQSLRYVQEYITT